jgi:hypothetical protein
MIPTLDDIVRFVVGAGLLLKNDERGMAAFDVSLKGFVQSFAAAVIALPIFAFVHFVQTRHLGMDGTPLGLAVLAYAVRWLAFPLTAAALAKMMHREQHFVPYVVAANWASIIQIGIVAAAVLLSTLLSSGVAAFLILVVTVGLLVYDFFIARIAFQTPGIDGGAVVLVQLLVSMLVQHLVTGG